MNPSYVVVADAARARIFAVNAAPGAAGIPGTRLEEVEDLANPIARQRPSEAFTESRPALRQAGPRGPGHGVDDHREAHRAEADRSFARAIMEAVAARTGGYVRRVLLISPPRMLGYLRDARTAVDRDVELDELAKEMTSLSASQLHARLVERQLLTL
jgi:protein required for attachment to host cells